MLVALLQNTCTSAAHSASAQVITTASAVGSCVGVASSCGAGFPTAAQFTTGKSGVLLMDGRNFFENSSAVTAAETRRRAGCNASVECDAFPVAGMFISLPKVFFIVDTIWGEGARPPGVLRSCFRPSPHRRSLDDPQVSACWSYRPKRAGQPILH